MCIGCVAADEHLGVWNAASLFSGMDGISYVVLFSGRPSVIEKP